MVWFLSSAWYLASVIGCQPPSASFLRMKNQRTQVEIFSRTLACSHSVGSTNKCILASSRPHGSPFQSTIDSPSHKLSTVSIAHWAEQRKWHSVKADKAFVHTSSESPSGGRLRPHSCLNAMFCVKERLYMITAQPHLHEWVTRCYVQLENIAYNICRSANPSGWSFTAYPRNPYHPNINSMIHVLMCQVNKHIQ